MCHFFHSICLISNALMRCILGSYEGRQNRGEIRKGKQIPNLGERDRCRSRSPRRSPSPRQTRSPGRGNRRRSESGSPRRKQSPEQFLNLRTGTSYRSSRKSPRQNSSPRQIPSLGKESRCRYRSRSPRRRWWIVVKAVIFLFLAQSRKHDWRRDKIYVSSDFCQHGQKVLIVDEEDIFQRSWIE